MLDNCAFHKLDIIFTKSNSHFRRDTVETIEALSKLKYWCNRYKHNEEGKLIIDEETTKNVKTIFDLYLSRQRILGIIEEVETWKIPSPTGKEEGDKRTIAVMLSNEKYTGDVLLLKIRKSETHYLATENNPVIIAKVVF